MKKGIMLCLLSLCTLAISADEGMWMIGNLNKKTHQALKHAGLELPMKRLYNPKKPALANAIVSFGGFCTGVVVSSDGLVFTNHHCGFDAIQQHSTMEHDYLTDGFIARNREEELPNPELYVRFLLRSENVTRRVLACLSDTMDENSRQLAVDSISRIIQQEVSAKDSTVAAVVDAYYAGNEYWLSVYRDYEDIRLVFAPPSSIGKFGWDTDNWMWPRHTGDFSVFRIYADKNNRPAEYSPDNVPYHPTYVAPISLEGYAEGDFSMTLGYPGATERYLSSFGIEEMMITQNQAMIDIRGIKQEIWKQAMNARPKIAISYASKYDESSNYWKNSIGVNEAISKLHILERKREMERSLQRWIGQEKGSSSLLHLLTDLELNYKERREPARARAYFEEAFLNAPELIQLAYQLLNFDYDAPKEIVQAAYERITTQLDNFDETVDKQVFVAMLREYRGQVAPEYLPQFYQVIADSCGGNEQMFADSIYRTTAVTHIATLDKVVRQDSTFVIIDDPAVSIVLDLLVTYIDFMQRTNEVDEHIERDERRYNAAIRQMNDERNYYPDANFTMRLSFGTVGGYAPNDGVEYRFFTTTEGIAEKVRAHVGDRDFTVQPALLDLLMSHDNYGRYANDSGGMNVCFITNNDITGGNSGSPMFNARGELIGLAFDGNWEAMSSDLIYEPRYQRCIGVDVRYVLFLIEKMGQANALIQELTIR
ncbi:MAG: S46 family peptidase [Prevotellaceae bacterium]|jgi:tetratricopeptide (TPR) repeat protein|nr:S46 family peptidase [Prevotellaceae bacterium]